MTELALDRFRKAGLPDKLERRAQDIADQLGPYRWDYATLCGYLSASVAVDLERGRFGSRDRLAVDLRVVEIMKTKPSRPVKGASPMVHP